MLMNRKEMLTLKAWKAGNVRKPLIIRGARQVGKTWLMKEFGKLEYRQVAYVNFESNAILKTLFTTDYDVERILRAISIETGIIIDETNTLLIFDEIQEAAGGLTS